MSKRFALIFSLLVAACFILASNGFVPSIHPQTHASTPISRAFSTEENRAPRAAALFGTDEIDLISILQAPGEPGAVRVVRHDAALNPLPETTNPAMFVPTGPNDALRIFDLADLDGDGTNELIVFNENRLEPQSAKGSGQGAQVHVLKAFHSPARLESVQSLSIDSETAKSVELTRNRLKLVQASGGNSPRLRLEATPGMTGNSTPTVHVFEAERKGGPIRLRAESPRISTLETAAGLSAGANTETLNAGLACSYRLLPVPNIDTYPYNAGSYALAVYTGNDCPWEAAGLESWITVTQGSGPGSGGLYFRLAANPNTTRRVGSIRVNAGLYGGASYTVFQEGNPNGCVNTISPSNASFTASGGTETAQVTASTTCSWTATPSAGWVTILSGGSGTGSNIVTYSVASNTGSASRTAIITLTGGNSLRITQAGGGTTCSYGFSSSSQTLPATGGDTSVGIQATSGCTWTASTATSWISFPFSNQGSGSGTLSYRVEPNPGSSRTGYVTLTGGQTLTVNQSGTTTTCTYGFSQSTQSVSSSGGDFSVGVTTGSTCGWTATDNVSWISFPFGSGGTGSGTLVYRVAANSSTSSRTGIISLPGGQTLTVTQDGTASGGCVLSVSPVNLEFTDLGGNGGISVTAVSGCGWTATASASWIRLTTTSGSGNGTVFYTVDPNTSLFSRFGTITIGGQVVNVNQEGKPF